MLATKLELIEAELSLLSVMNFAAGQRIEVLDDMVKNIGGPCSHANSNLYPNWTDWHAVEKDIEARKQAAYRATRKSVAAQVAAQSLRAAKDWDL